MGVLDRLMNKEDFTEAFTELQKNHRKVTEELELQKKVNESLAAKIVEMENRLDLLMQDPERVIEEEIEKRTLQLEKDYEEKMNHKWYNAGRMDAYGEMGIRNIEAHERDNILVRLPDGEVVEQILGLEDVKPSTDGVLSDDEITIDDLVDTTA